MLAIFSNTLKSQKSHLRQWKPENNSQILLQVTMLVNRAISKCFKLRMSRMQIDCNLTKSGELCVLEKIT